MKNIKTVQLVRAAVIAALYVVLTVTPPLNAIAFGPIQCRISEALTILPLFFVEAVPGVAIGCLISNLFGFGVYDIIFGTLTTLTAAFLTYKLRKIHWGVIPPILLNALVVPAIILLSGAEEAYWFMFLTVGAGEAIAVIGLGVPLWFALKKLQPRASFLQTEKKPVTDTPAENDW